VQDVCTCPGRKAKTPGKHLCKKCYLATDLKDTECDTEKQPWTLNGLHLVTVTVLSKSKTKWI
jgi:hypothetical protein